MGLLEFLFERSNPGPVGEINTSGKKPERPEIWVLIIKLVVSIAWIGFLFYVFVLSELSAGRVIGFIVGFTIYCLVGYFIIPKPDYSNIGWAGGLMDNPFRYSDDLNRLLMMIQVVLYPGRFIAVTFIQVILLIKGAYKS